MADREIKYTTKDAALAAIRLDIEDFSFVSDELRNDKDVVLAAVFSDGSLLEFASDELRNDWDVVSAALAAPWKPFESPYFKKDSALKYASEQLRNDLKFVLPEINSNGYALRYVSEDIRTAREVALTVIQCGSGGFFEFVADDFCNDREVVLAAVNRNGCMLEYASAELRNDKDVVLAAVNKNGGALQYTSEALRNDKEIVLAAVNNFCGDNFECVSDELRDDKDVVLAAVKIYNYSLKYASDKLRNDRDVLFAALASQGEHYCDELWNYAGKEILNNRECILAAAQYCGEWLKYAADELHNDKDVMLEAVSSDGGLLEFASDELRNDKEVVSAALAAPWKPFESPFLKNDSALKYASEQLRSDREFVLPDIKSNFFSLKYASDDIRNDKELVLQLVHGSEGGALEFASDELRNDKDMVLAIVSIVGEALEYASENLRNDKDIVLAAMRSDRYGLALSYASSEMQNDKDIVLAAVNKERSSALQFASEALRNDKEVVLVAMKASGGGLGCVSDELRNDKEIVLAAVNKYGLALNDASDELRNDVEVVSAAVGHDDWGDVVFGDLSEEMQDDPDVGYAFDCRHGRLVQFWNLLKPSGDKAPEVKIMYYKMMPAEFFEKLIGLYCEARKSKFSNPNVLRGRSASISSSLEDLFADFIAQNNPNKCTYYIDQPMKFEGEENHKYPDIVIQNQDDVIEHLIDIKADIGLNRHGMLDLCMEWEKRIEAAKGSDSSFKNGDSKETLTGKFSNNLKCHVVVVTQENSSEKKLLEDYDQVKTQCKNVGLYILSSGKHPNEYGFEPKDLLKQIFIRSEDFDRLLSSITTV
jgi:hypothetical protein